MYQVAIKYCNDSEALVRNYKDSQIQQAIKMFRSYKNFIKENVGNLGVTHGGHVVEVTLTDVDADSVKEKFIEFCEHKKP